ncbi:MAG: hypothetical protein KME64_04140 [Scytonematopsis contorta HA4267-MV1]|jgi:hypothetical protein|nr:hypothetical protein [Scytonematopsis contorta HA4267-MV1]
MGKIEVPSEIKRNLKTFNQIAHTLQSLFIVLASTAVISTLVVTTFTDNLEKKDIKTIAFVAALSSAFINAFNLNRKASDARNAWRHLHSAVMEYENSENFNIDKLLAAHKEAEKIMGNIMFVPPNRLDQ